MKRAHGPNLGRHKDTDTNGLGREPTQGEGRCIQEWGADVQRTIQTDNPAHSIGKPWLPVKADVFMSL